MIVYLGSNELKKVYLGNTEIKKIYVGDKQVRPDKWYPTSNTLLYMPLNSSNTNKDIVGQHSILNTAGNVRYGNYGGVDCANFTSIGYFRIGNISLPGQWTFLLRVNCVNGYSSSNSKGSIWRIDNKYCGFSYNSSGYYAWENNTYFNISTRNKRYLFVYCNGSSTSQKKQYLFDGTNIYSISAVNNDAGLNTSSSFGFGSNETNLTDNFLGYMSNAILENKIRTQQEILNYANKTKEDYGY